MTANDASAAGSFRIGVDLLINRLGFGAMRIAARETLRQNRFPAGFTI